MPLSDRQENSSWIKPPSWIKSRPGPRSAGHHAQRLRRLCHQCAAAGPDLRKKTGVFDVDIACACDTETLLQIFSPTPSPYTGKKAMAMLQENGVTLCFYSTDVEDASHPEMSQLRITPRLARLLAEPSSRGQLKSSNTNDPEAASSKTSTRPEASSWSACRARRSPRTTCSPSVPCATRRTSICPSTRTRG